MNWTSVTQWAELSDCGRYSVAMTRDGEAYLYHAWRRPVERGNATLLLTTPDNQAAKGACEADASVSLAGELP